MRHIYEYFKKSTKNYLLVWRAYKSVFVCWIKKQVSSYKLALQSKSLFVEWLSPCKTVHHFVYMPPAAISSQLLELGIWWESKSNTHCLFCILVRTPHFLEFKRIQHRNYKHYFAKKHKTIVTKFVLKHWVRCDERTDVIVR